MLKQVVKEFNLEIKKMKSSYFKDKSVYLEKGFWLQRMGIGRARSEDLMKKKAKTDQEKY